MKGDTGVVREGVEELADALGGEHAQAFPTERNVPVKLTTSTDVDGHEDQGIIHHGMEAGVPLDRLIAEGFLEGAAEHDSDVFDGVVIVDGKIAFDLDSEVEDAMKGELFEHVVEKADAGLDIPPISAIEVKHEVDGGFAGFSVLLGVSNAGRVAHLVHCGTCLTVSGETAKLVA
jgi:hypothetical protein